MKVRLPLRSILLPTPRVRPPFATADLQFRARPSPSIRSPSHRCLSSSRPHLSNPPPQSQPPAQTNPSHWLSHQKSRIGKCILFGLNHPQLELCSEILRILSTEWRLLVAGREGFLTSDKQAGLTRHKVVWGEMDSMGHVNNVMYVRYAETGRVEWLCGLGRGEVGRKEWSELMTPKGARGLILKSIKVDFKFPMKYPDHISVFHKLRSSPSSTQASDDPSSFILDVLIVSELHQRPAARCEEDIVVYDYKAAKKTPISGFMKEGFERTWREQEEEKRRAKEKIREVEELVRRLEKESWDREGAVEDIGGKK